MDYLSGLGLYHHVLTQNRSGSDECPDAYLEFYPVPKPNPLWSGAKRLGAMIMRYRHGARARQ